MPFTTRNNWKVLVPELIQANRDGVTQTALAVKFGVTRQRMKQIFQRYKIKPIGLKLKKEKKDQEHFLKWGDRNGSDLYDAQRKKFRAKKNNILRKGGIFTLNFGELEWPKYCPVLGIEIEYFAEERQENSPSFDQIDPGKGYVKGNVQIMSWRANRIKNDGTEEEHRKIADWLSSLKEK